MIATNEVMVHWLATATDISSHRWALKEILESECSELVEAEKLQALLDVLAPYVAHAASERADKARKGGALSARQSVANALGLGELKPGPFDV
jgi:hypothetical protein